MRKWVEIKEQPMTIISFLGCKWVPPLPKWLEAWLRVLGFADSFNLTWKEKNGIKWEWKGMKGTARTWLDMRAIELKRRKGNDNKQDEPPQRSKTFWYPVANFVVFGCGESVNKWHRRKWKGWKGKKVLDMLGNVWNQSNYSWRQIILVVWSMGSK